MHDEACEIVKLCVCERTLVGPLKDMVQPHKNIHHFITSLHIEIFIQVVVNESGFNLPFWDGGYAISDSKVILGPKLRVAHDEH